MKCYKEGLSELYRVLKPKGKVFLGVYGAGGLLNERKIRFYRLLAKFIPYSLMRNILPVRVKNELLDNLYVPVRRAFSEKQFLEFMKQAGFTHIQRISDGFYRRPRNLRERFLLGPNGMYMHFLAEKV